MVLKCQVPACNYKPEDDVSKDMVVTMADLVQMMMFHTNAVHPRQPAPVGDQIHATAKVEKVKRPQLVTKGSYATEEDREYFIFRWDAYKSMANLGTTEKSHLVDSLGDMVVSNVYGWPGSEKYEALSLGELLKEVRHLVVRSRNKLVHRLKLGSMVQDGDEPVAAFESRLKPVARTGKFQVECPGCNQKVDYTDQMVLDNLIRGLADEEVKKKVLATQKKECTLAKILQLVEAEESGKYSLTDSKMFDSVAGLSNFKKQQRDQVKQEPPVDPAIHRLCGKRHKAGNCPKLTCYF